MSEIKAYAAVDITSGRRPTAPLNGGASSASGTATTAAPNSYGSASNVGGGASSNYNLFQAKDLSSGSVGVFQAKEPPTLNKPGQFHELDKQNNLTSDSIPDKKKSDGGKGGIFGAIGSIAGGVIGTAFGGPLGGSIGSALGGALGGALDG